MSIIIRNIEQKDNAILAKIIRSCFHDFEVKCTAAVSYTHLDVYKRQLLVLAITFIGFVLFIQKKLKIQNKKIELQSLRREMNPHFIFNSLNSVNQFIATNNELEANQYPVSYTHLDVYKRQVYIILFTIFLSTNFYAQTARVEEVKTEAKKLKKAISTDDAQLEAESYVNLADGYYND